MGDVWFYRLIFVFSVILGIVIPESNLIRLALVSGGMRGLLMDQEISKEKLEFEQQRYLRELDQSISPQRREGNVEASGSRRDLTLPADPGEGY
jgi:hypothetical protein